MSEKRERAKRRERRESILSIMADGTNRKDAERIYKTLTRENVPAVGHSSALCKSRLGLHDFGKQQRREGRWEQRSAVGPLKERQVYKKGPRARVCRACSKGEQIQTRSGVWINGAGVKL